MRETLTSMSDMAVGLGVWFIGDGVAMFKWHEEAQKILKWISTPRRKGKGTNSDVQETQVHNFL